MDRLVVDPEVGHPGKIIDMIDAGAIWAMQETLA
jgi:hypothetical protein